MLSDFLVSELFAFLLVFCRLGSALMVLPGFGEVYVSARARLMLALMFSLALAPAIQSMPPVPSSIAGVVMLISAEILTGLFLGGISRLLITAIHMAGMIIAYQSSLASALVPDVAQAQGGQGSMLGNMLSMTALVLLFATDLHHVMLKGLADSYMLFLPGHFPMVDDFAEHSSRIMSGAFAMSMKLAAPHLVIGIILYLGSGIISRLMPGIQIFFIMLPPQLVLSFFLLMIIFSSMMMWYMDYFKETLGGFLAP